MNADWLTRKHQSCHTPEPEPCVSESTPWVETHRHLTALFFSRHFTNLTLFLKMISSVFFPFILVVAVGVFGSVPASPVVEQVYRDVVSVVSPGQESLSGDSLRFLFNTLEKRVQCRGSDVSCEKVSFMILTPSAWAGWRGPGPQL